MKQNIAHFIKHYLVADTPRLSFGEGLKSALGTASGVAFVLAATFIVADQPLILAAVGATAIIVFSMPHSPLAQPWSVLGGYLLAALAALLVSSLTSNLILGVWISLALVVLLMAALKCMHPPAGAIAIFVAANKPVGMVAVGAMLGGVLLTAGLIILAAIVINKLLGRRYPQCVTDHAPPALKTGITHADIDYALKKHDTYVDVQESELIDIYETAVQHAVARTNKVPKK